MNSKLLIDIFINFFLAKVGRKFFHLQGGDGGDVEVGGDSRFVK